MLLGTRRVTRIAHCGSASQRPDRAWSRAVVDGQIGSTRRRRGFVRGEATRPPTRAVQCPTVAQHALVRYAESSYAPRGIYNVTCPPWPRRKDPCDFSP
jgi:hypothetical protein